MNYLTREEARQVNAVHAYTPRKLTPVEEVIKRAVEVAEMPDVTDVLRNNKKAFMRDIIRHLEEVTSSDRLIGQVRDGMTDPAAMKQLIESYPFVEFEQVLNKPYFGGLQQAAIAGITNSELRICVAWLEKLFGIIRELPRGVKAFVATPETDYNGLYQEARFFNKPEAWGVSLNKDLQKRIFTLFREGHRNWEISRIAEYGLLGYHDLEKRLGIPPIDRTYISLDRGRPCQIALAFDSWLINNNAVPVIRAILCNYEILSEERLEGVYLFSI
jgi:hypothetical protein